MFTEKYVVMIVNSQKTEIKECAMKKIIFLIFVLSVSIIVLSAEYYIDYPTIYDEYFLKELEAKELNPNTETGCVYVDDDVTFYLVPFDALSFFYYYHSFPYIGKDAGLSAEFYNIQISLFLKDVKNYYYLTIKNFSEKEIIIDTKDLFERYRVLNIGDFFKYSPQDTIAIYPSEIFSVMIVPNNTEDLIYEDFLKEKFEVNGILFQPYLSDYIQEMYSESRKMGEFLELDYLDY